jgi:hypothetical protein
MERFASPVSFQEKELPGPRRIRRWLGGLLGRSGIASGESDGAMSEDNGVAGNGQPDDVHPKSDPAIRLLVEHALEEAGELAKHEAGSEYGRLCKPLLLGPQRYRNPDMWAPNYRLRGVAIGEENTPEQIAEMKKVPLTQDEFYVKASEILESLDAELGLTASNE